MSDKDFTTRGFPGTIKELKKIREVLDKILDVLLVREMKRI
tara:strand:+ start:284 stop:406 length:123 start_codon:yes stop_codon:yes gene_type:complete